MSEKEITPALWDTYQYIFSCLHDRMLHVVLTYKGCIDISALRTVVGHAAASEPILRSSYSPGYFYSSWVPHLVNLNRIVSVDVVTSEKDRESSVRNFITSEIPPSADHQVEFRVVRFQTDSAEALDDTLCVLMNHMVMDGTDFKYFLETLIEMYNQLVQTGKITTSLKNGSRSVETQFDLMRPHISEAAKKATDSKAKPSHVCVFPFTNDTECTSRIARVKVPKSVFAPCAAKAKSLDVTVNDVVVTAFFRALKGLCPELKDGSPTSVFVDFDLRRRHIPQENGGTTPGLTNFVTESPVNAKVQGNATPFEDTLAQVHAEMATLKEDELCGLYGIWLGSTVFHYLPVSIASAIFRRGYCSPSIGVSNLGVFARERYTLSGTALEDVFMAGSVKYKPHFLAAVFTFDNEMSFSVGFRGSSNDEALVVGYLEKVKAEIESFVSA